MSAFIIRYIERTQAGSDDARVLLAHRIEGLWDTPLQFEDTWLIQSNETSDHIRDQLTELVPDGDALICRIMWDKHLGALPRTILIVGDDRSEPIARLRFVACTNLPKLAPAGDRAVRTRGPNARAKPPEQAPTRALPHGAIQ